MSTPACKSFPWAVHPDKKDSQAALTAAASSLVKGLLLWYIQILASSGNSEKGTNIKD